MKMKKPYCYCLFLMRKSQINFIPFKWLIFWTKTRKLTAGELTVAVFWPFSRRHSIRPIRNWQFNSVFRGVLFTNIHGFAHSALFTLYLLSLTLCCPAKSGAIYLINFVECKFKYYRLTHLQMSQFRSRLQAGVV